MPLETITEIDLDTNQPGVSIVHAKQYDTARKVRCNLFYSGVKWLVPSSNIEAVVGFKKADRIGGFYDETEDGETAITVDNEDRSIIYVILDRNLVTTEGNVNTEITFYDAVTRGRLSTFSFIVQVEEASVTELDLASNPYFNVLAEDIATVLEAESKLTGLTATATKKAPNATPTVTVTGGSQAGQPYNFNFGIPSMPAITTNASKLSATANPTATITGGTSAGQAYNIAFGIPAGMGVNASSTVTVYGVSANSSTLPSTWTSNVQTLTIPDGYFLWSKTTLTFEDNSTHVYYSKVAQGEPGPSGVAVQTTSPNTSVKVWINPEEDTTITIPDIKDNTIASDSTYSSQKIESLVNKDVNYITLLNGDAPTTSVVTKTLYSNRKISDYNVLLAIAKRGDFTRVSSIVPRTLFNSNIAISLTEVDSANTQRWYEIKYVSDTSVTIQKSSTASSDSVSLYLYGIYLE